MSDTATDEIVVDTQLKELCSDFNYTYASIQDKIIKTINDEIVSLGLPQSTKEAFVVKGIELVCDTALKIAVAKVSNKDNLALKALDSTAQMLGMLAQGGLEISQLQFDVYYNALKEIMSRGGVTIEYTSSSESQ